MSDYDVNIQAQIQGLDNIESRLKALESKGFHVKINLTGTDGELEKQLQSITDLITSQMSKAVEEAAANFTAGFSSGSSGAEPSSGLGSSGLFQGYIDGVSKVADTINTVKDTFENFKTVGDTSFDQP